MDYELAEVSRFGSMSLSGSVPLIQRATWQEDHRGFPRPFMAGFGKTPPREWNVWIEEILYELRKATSPDVRVGFRGWRRLQAGQT